MIAEPPRNRFLFVDIAALRAKQLRRGARPRLGRDIEHPLKAERIAMEEVAEGFVGYDLPEFKASRSTPDDAIRTPPETSVSPLS